MTTADLPLLNAVLNGTAFVFLTIGYRFIKRGKWQAHRMMMIAAFCTSILFLVSYLVYHAQEGSTPYEGGGIGRIIYFAILISHVVLAATVPFLAIATLYRAWKNPWDKHAKIARITFPIWMYVSVTGVVVYLMLYQF